MEDLVETNSLKRSAAARQHLVKALADPLDGGNSWAIELQAMTQSELKLEIGRIRQFS